MATATEKRRVEVQADPRQVESWQRAADARGLLLAAWIRYTLNSAVGQRSTKQKAKK